MVQNNVINFVKNYLKTGFNNNNDPEQNQQILVANLFGLIGYVITFIMSMAAFIRSDWLLASILLGASILFFSSRLILTNKKLNNPHRSSTGMVTASLLVLMIYLVYSGGVANTGPLWIYVVPPVALFFGGLSKGTRTLGIFIFLISIMLFYPDDLLLKARYSLEFKLRLLYSFLTVSLLFAFYEYSRQESYKLSQNISRKFENQARIDLLSNIPNRRGISEMLEQEFSRTKRYQTDLSLIMCDIDHFKMINDKYSHQAGDNVISQIASSFQDEIRQHDTVARWGGEEYLFLLPETSIEQAYNLAEKLRKKIEARSFAYNEQTFQVTVSMGVYQIAKEDSINHAITLADKRLYLAKNSGRNQTIADDSPMS